MRTLCHRLEINSTLRHQNRWDGDPPGPTWVSIDFPRACDAQSARGISTVVRAGGRPPARARARARMDGWMGRTATNATRDDARDDAIGAMYFWYRASRRSSRRRASSRARVVANDRPRARPSMREASRVGGVDDSRSVESRDRSTGDASTDRTPVTRRDAAANAPAWK